MATAIHSFSPEEIMAYLDGELSAQRALLVATHLEECGECKNLASELRGLSRELSNWGVETSGGAVPAPQPEMEPRQIALWRRQWLVTCAAALGIICVATMTRFARKGVVEPDVAHLQSYAQLMSAPESDRATGLFERAPHAVREIIGNAPAPAAGPLVVKTGRLSLTSNKFDGMRSSVERITVAHQGYIGQLELNTRAGASRSITASLRVPAWQLDSVIEELKRLGRVDSESQTGEDVTQRSVNLDARLANLHTTETRLQEILKDRTGKLADVLQVEEAVDRTRGEIEQAEAERKLLSSQISFATLELNVSEEYKAPLEGHGSVLNLLRNAAVQGYRNAVDSVLDVLTFFLSTGLTLLLVLVIGFCPALWLWRWWREHRSL